MFQRLVSVPCSQIQKRTLFCSADLYAKIRSTKKQQNQNQLIYSQNLLTFGNNLSKFIFRAFANEQNKKKKQLPLIHPIVQQQKPIEVPERLKMPPRTPPKNALTEPAFAVVHVGGTQYKVMPGDNILTHRLNGSVVGSEIVLNKVLLVGTKTWTAVGQPILTQAKVHAIVEEHTLAENVIVFKKKRRKNYRRTKGHRENITNLRILDISFEGPVPNESHQQSSLQNSSSAQQQQTKAV